MKKNILLILSLCLVFLSCSKDDETPPLLNVNQPNVTVDGSGGSKSISFESNMKWTASSSETWCAVSPSNGDASIKEIILTISENDGHSDRACTVTITAGSLSKTINVNQSSNLGLLVTQDEYNLSNAATTIEVEVKSNVEFDVVINDDWITKEVARSLPSTILKFNIAENEDLEPREGSITIKSKDGTLSNTITVIQSETITIINKDDAENLSSDSQKIRMEVETTVQEFEVIIPEDATSWISVMNGTRASRTEYVIFEVDENNEGTLRSAEIAIKSKTSKLQDTFIISQIAKGVTIVNIETMGTLDVLLNQTQKDTITSLLLQGEMNEKDFAVLKNGMPALLHLDLKDVQIEIIPTRAIGHGSEENANQSIMTITLPSSIKEIDDYAFAYMPSLASVKFPKSNNLKSIGPGAFAGCLNLKEKINIPEGVETIEGSAFYKTGITGLSLPESLVDLKGNSFLNNPFMTGALIIPDGVTDILGSTFRGCTGITELILPSGLKTIGERAFNFLRSVEGEVVFPKSVESIGPEAFAEFWEVDAFVFPHTTPLNYANKMFDISHKDYEGDPFKTIKVPKEAVAAYEAADGWKDHPIVGY